MPAVLEPLRLAEVIGVLGIATDFGTGQPVGHSRTAAVLAARIAEAVHASEEEAGDAFYLASLKFIGCTTESHVAAEILGDELAAGAWWGRADMANPAELLPHIYRNQAPDATALKRAAATLRMVARMPRFMEMARAHCEVAERLVERLRLPRGVRYAIGDVYERWDGKGLRKKRGEAIPRALRIANLAHDLAVQLRFAPVDEALAVVRSRAGGMHDPSLIGALDASLAEGVANAGWPELLAAEPGPRPLVGGSEFRELLPVFADFVDLKLPELAGHSREVASLAAQAARGVGLGRPEVEEVEQAGMLQDLGRVGVSAGVWARPGPLSPDDREKVRLHSYYTERILAGPERLRRAADLAGLHHERMDGSGYHRGAAGRNLPFAARLLGAADAYRAMLEPRPHRAALAPEAAAKELRHEARLGRHDAEAVEAVLDAAGHRASPRRRSWPAGLTDREVEVLRLVARGHSTPEVAELLHVSRKTAAHHVEHIYDRIGVSTRAGAAVFAMENDLLES